MGERPIPVTSPYTRVVQLVERRPVKANVGGSNPPSGASLVFPSSSAVVASVC